MGLACTFQAQAQDKPAQQPQQKGVVINGVAWATCNVGAFGAFAEKPESDGMLYQWNKKTAWSTTGGVKDWDDTHRTGDVWIEENDPSPKGWRIPTAYELKTLLDTEKVSRVWTTLNGVYGTRFTDKITGNSIFLPAAGYRDSIFGMLSGGTGNKASGYYWSSTDYLTYGMSSITSYYLFFNNSKVELNNDKYKSYGFSVRCVAK